MSTPAPSGEWNEEAQAFLPPPPPDPTPGPQLMQSAADPAGPVPAPAGAQATVDQKAMVTMRRQILALGGIQCPFCEHAFVPERTAVPQVPAVAAPAPALTTDPGQTIQHAPVAAPAVDPPLPVVDDEAQRIADELDEAPTHPEHGISGTHVPGYEAAEAVKEEVNAGYTNAQKLKILQQYKFAEGDEEMRVTILVRHGLNRQHIASWMGMQKRGQLTVEEPESL